MIVVPSDIELNNPEKILTTSIKSNKDGWGVIIRNPATGKIDVFRDYMTETQSIKNAIETYYLRDPAEEFIFHARQASPGTWRDKDNTHPFLITKDVWLMHNGAIDIEIKEDKFCDSYHLAKFIGDEYRKNVVEKGLSNSIEEWLRYEPNKLAIDALVKKNNESKVIIVDIQGYLIFNENAGFWKDGVWFSNHSAFREVSWRTNGMPVYRKIDLETEDREKFQKTIEETPQLAHLKDHAMLSEEEIKIIEARIEAKQRFANVEEEPLIFETANDAYLEAQNNWKKGLLKEAPKLRPKATESTTKQPQLPMTEAKNNKSENFPFSTTTEMKKPGANSNLNGTKTSEKGSTTLLEWVWLPSKHKDVIPFLNKCIGQNEDSIKKVINKNSLTAARAIHHLLNKELPFQKQVEEESDAADEVNSINGFPLWGCDYHQQNPQKLKVLYHPNGEISWVGCNNCDIQRIAIETDLKESEEQTNKFLEGVA